MKPRRGLCIGLLALATAWSPAVLPRRSWTSLATSNTPQQESSWLPQATDRLLATEAPLQRGKWHEVLSLFHAWSSRTKSHPDEAPRRMEALLQRLVDEGHVVDDLPLYNKLLDAWCCAALFGTQSTARAREILLWMQESSPMTPNAESFALVFHAIWKTEATIVARRWLAWMEHVARTSNPSAHPTPRDYTRMLETYAHEQQGVLASALLRHMREPPDTFGYNLAIKAWGKNGRNSAEQAEQILLAMPSPDVVSYASVMGAWAASGMKAHAVRRVEDLLRHMDERDIEPNTVVLNAVLSTWVKSKNPAAVERTAEILRNMEGSVSPPDLISYNTHLHALMLHTSPKRPENALKAYELLNRMETMETVQPNLFSYNLVLRALNRVNKVQDAANVLRQLVQRGIEPDTFSFNQVLAALARVRAADTAYELLQYQIESGTPPDVASYASVLSAYGPERVGEAENMLRNMKIPPNAVCYNVMMDLWAKSGQGTLGARKAEQLLQEMQDRYEAGNEAMKPTLVSYNALLNAWARSGTRCCGHKAETYLDQMWELYRAGDKKVKPNDCSYNTVINAISKSQNEGKAQKALRVLRRMDKMYQAGNKDARPDTVTYTAVLNSCAFPAVLDSRTRRKAWDTALFTLQELRESRYGHPNQVTYGVFIKACGNLLHDDDELRRDVIRQAFRQCCIDGQVGEMVLSYLRKAAPSDLYAELLQLPDARRTTRIRLEDLPHEWRCNVRSNEGWKASKGVQRVPQRRRSP